MGYSGIYGKLIHEKTWSRKSRVRLPLSGQSDEIFTLSPFSNILLGISHLQIKAHDFWKFQIDNNQEDCFNFEFYCLIVIKKQRDSNILMQPVNLTGTLL
jgi:hypothetical protein